MRRKGFYFSAEDERLLGEIERRYGCVSESQAIRLALRALAGRPLIGEVALPAPGRPGPKPKREKPKVSNKVVKGDLPEQVEEAVRVVNDMKASGVIETYAIGGAMAVNFYTEPTETKDVDFFIALPKPRGKIVTMQPIYDYMREKGYEIRDVWINVGRVPIQFIPVYDNLSEEALDQAVDALCGKTPTRVFRIEHGLAIMTQLLRPKDKVRILSALDQAEIDFRRLEEILCRHGLWEKWKDFVRKFRET